MNIGVVGLGRMGMAACRKLMEHGHSVAGWDINTSLGPVLEAAGGQFAVSPSDLVAQSEIILSLVTDDAAARWLFGDQGGLLKGMIQGKLYIELSTLQPATAVEIGERALAAGAEFVAGPVVGSIPAVLNGKLLVLAGGAVNHVERARTVLQPLARDVVRLGPLGSGNTMKLIVNLTMAAYLQALAEGLTMGQEAGLDLEQMLQLLTEAPTANPWLQSKLQILAGNEGDVSLDIASMHKDVMSAVATGSALGVAMPAASGILSFLSTAVATGHGRDDMARLPRVFQKWMVRRSPAPN